ncbi:aTP phosphoribosyltransferase [Prevotella sp. CAG:617]|jgi:ATP phosphoribosyltransferase|nr:aTP phosphoribosyltransferase [Prevotella sp. CAG:617]
MLRIAIQSKGRLNEDSMKLLAEAGIKVGTSKRTLLTAAKNFPIEILFLRDDDIPETVADGVADIGIVGLNELKEKNANVNIVRPLGFGGCRLSLAIPKEITYDNPSWFNNKKIATSYPHILQNYLQEQNIQAEIHVITGSVEISPSIGLADAIFDIVSSGSTLISNNLKEVERILESEAVMIATPGLSDEKQDLLNELLFRIEAVKSAEDKKYVLMNAPKDKVNDIVKVLPGIKSPTIMPLAESDWCSIHTVLDETRFWEIIGQIKANGAQGILVLPIEKMIL